MKLVKELEVRESIIKTGKNAGKVKKKLYGLFECPACGKHVEHVMYTGKSRNSCGASGCKSKTSNKYGHRKLPSNKHKRANSAYKLFNDFYNRQIAHSKCTTTWGSYKEFEKEMFTSYDALKVRGSKYITLYVTDHNIISKDNSYFIDASSLRYTDFTEDVNKGIYHSLMLSVELDIPHATVLKSINNSTGVNIDTTKFSSASEYGYISKPIKTVLLTENEYSIIKNRILDYRKGRLSSQNVYLVKCLDRIKIGIAKDVDVRIKTLAGANAFPIEKVYSTRHVDAIEIEKKLHAKYKEFNKHHEWFSLPDEQVKEIITYLDSLK